MMIGKEIIEALKDMWVRLKYRNATCRIVPGGVVVADGGTAGLFTGVVVEDRDGTFYVVSVDNTCAAWVNHTDVVPLPGAPLWRWNPVLAAVEMITSMNRNGAPVVYVNGLPMTLTGCRPDGSR